MITYVYIQALNIYLKAEICAKVKVCASSPGMLSLNSDLFSVSHSPHTGACPDMMTIYCRCGQSHSQSWLQT